MFFAIEGIDRTGKTTLVKNLYRIANKSNKSCFIKFFPSYTETIYGRLIRMYLDGYFGPLNGVDINFTNIIYAADRYEQKSKLIHHINSNQIVICDRYTASNLSYSSSKILNAQFPDEKINSLEEKHIIAIESNIKKISDIEQKIMRLPNPDLYLLLDADYEKLPSFNRSEKDLHEKNTNYINTVSAVYRHLANNNILGQWTTFKLSKNGRHIPKDELTEKIWHEVILPRI